jgi:chemotaxis protein methyltransferase CheR
MTPADLDFFRGWMHVRTGLQLTAEKAYLIESRLAPVARRHGLASVAAVIDAVRQSNAAIQRDVANAMMTHETFFFRDGRPFERFRQAVLPRLIAARAGRRAVRLWSAACSTGQEPYSLAMMLREEQARLAGWRCEIVATDISNDALTRAREGSFTQFEVQRGLPIQLLMKYFKQSGDRWSVGDDVRAMVQFREFNLLHDSRALGEFDAIFCRNVLIYFDQPTKAIVLENLARTVAGDGVIYLGGAETVIGITDALEQWPGEPGVYTPVQRGTQAPGRVAAAG